MPGKSTHARIKIGTASNSEIQQLGTVLEFMRERRQAGVPVLLPTRTPPATRLESTRQLVRAVRRTRRKAHFGVILASLTLLALLVLPLLA